MCYLYMETFCLTNIWNKWGYESVKHIVDFYFNTDGISTE